MNAFLSWLKKIITTGSEVVHPQQLATLNRLNRRKNFRISYSHIGPVPGLPKVSVGNDEIVVKNISTGGLLAIDDTGSIGQSVGTEFNLDLDWGNAKFTTRARVVGAQFERRHIQFVDFNPEVFRRISTLIRPAFVGSRFRKVQSQFLTPTVSELWTGYGNDNLKIGSPGNSHFLVLYGTSYELHPDEIFWSSGPNKVSQQMQSEILITLVNIPGPSNELKLLIERASSYPFTLDLTGTG